MEAFPKLAKTWLLTQAEAIWRDAVLPTVEEAAVLALRLIGVGEWPSIVSAFEDCYHLPDLIRSAVGRDMRRYRALLRRPALEPFHLAPLAGPPDSGWPRMVAAASEAGYSAQDIVSATLGATLSWQGNESEYWQTWVDALPATETVAPRVAEVIELLRGFFHDRIRKAKEAERARAIHGWG